MPAAPGMGLHPRQRAGARNSQPGQLWHGSFVPQAMSPHQAAIDFGDNTGHFARISSRGSRSAASALEPALAAAGRG